MKKEYKECEKGPSAIVYIKEENISLCIGHDNKTPLKRNGWELEPLVKPLKVRILFIYDNYIHYVFHCSSWIKRN